MINGLENESKAIRDSLHEIMWHLRGSISREEAYKLSPKERSELQEKIKERIKLVEETGIALL